MIFQQLGQLVRWSWGYHVLLAPKDKYDEYRDETAEEGRYRDEPDGDAGLISILDEQEAHEDRVSTPTTDSSDVYEPAGRTPVAGQSRASPAESDDEEQYTPAKKHRHPNGAHPPNYHSLPDDGINSMLSFPRIGNVHEPEIPEGVKGLPVRVGVYARRASRAVSSYVSETAKGFYDGLPQPAQKALAWTWAVWLRVYAFLWDFMNPPLWAMLIAIVVASIPDLQRLFFQEGSFIKNSVTSAVTQSAGVAVPLILVVLGANLARNTQNLESRDPEEAQIGTRLLVASLVCRMVLPTLLMAPILAVFAKYVPVSILDDPIFVIVCFLLTGAPSALQLAQICQINEVYETVMSKILFQSYVIWILPSTLILVMCALEVVEWAG